MLGEETCNTLQFSSSILLSLSDEELLKHLTDELEPTNERSRSQLVEFSAENQYKLT
jgi:hypothetical protein